MDILLYLSELLQQSKEVGITGLGTFYKKKFPGRYDKEKQSFLPPGYTLQFSTEVREENTLVNFISTKRNISAESANYYISQWVEENNKKLELEHEAILENIGRLFYTEHEGLSFEPAKDVNYGSEFYGLPPLSESEPVEEKFIPGKGEEDEIYEEIAEAPALKPDSEKKEQILPVIENI
jgi:nucleoid DNA-binding protein